MNAHAARAALFVADDARMHWHDKALWYVRTNRDKAVASVPEWETLRELASQVKSHTLSRLADYLETFEQNAVRLGAKVHWMPPNTTPSSFPSSSSGARSGW